jgi:hypothetical protein
MKNSIEAVISCKVEHFVRHKFFNVILSLKIFLFSFSFIQIIKTLYICIMIIQWMKIMLHYDKQNVMHRNMLNNNNEHNNKKFSVKWKSMIWRSFKSATSWQFKINLKRVKRKRTSWTKLERCDLRIHF